MNIQVKELKPQDILQIAKSIQGEIILGEIQAYNNLNSIFGSSKERCEKIDKLFKEYDEL